MKFVDEASIRVEAGNGGPGACSFRREKFIPFGGPDGGDGGRGGDVIVQAGGGLQQPIDYPYHEHFTGARGIQGRGKNRAGADSPPTILKVPVGTQVFEEDQETLIADLDKLGDSV